MVGRGSGIGISLSSKRGCTIGRVGGKRRIVGCNFPVNVTANGVRVKRGIRDRGLGASLDNTLSCACAPRATRLRALSPFDVSTFIQRSKGVNVHGSV